MTTETEQDTLPVSLDTEEEMAIIRCSKCSLDHEVVNVFARKQKL